MTDGASRMAIDYAWPPTLFRPRSEIRVVYLDLNHWIYLAKAATDRADGAPFRGALEALRRWRDEGRLLLPLSATHYMEMAGIRDPRQRADIAAVMEELSGFATLVDRAVVMRLELEAAIDSRLSLRPGSTPRVPIVGWGALQAIGMRGGLRIRAADGSDITETARMDWPGGASAFDAWRAESELFFERSILRGPTDAEVPRLQKDGWDPTAARRVAEQRARQEREQAERLAAEPRWRRGRLRDVVSARYLIFEVKAHLEESLQARRLEVEDVLTGRQAARELVDAMPSADVCVSLLTSSHRNLQTDWSANHIFDIDALSIAVPYCDTVVTDRHAAHALRAAGLPSRLGTVVFATLVQLADALNAERS